MKKSKKILFVCVENAGRSQIAEGFLRKFAPQFEVESAGTKPQSELNSTVVKVMEEIGINIMEQKPKPLTQEMIAQSVIVNMGCIDYETCPALFLEGVIDWNISDPKGKNIDQVRQIRDQIKHHVLTLIKDLESDK